MALGQAQCELLLAERAAQHSAMALQEGRLVDVELIGVDLALHDVLAEPVGAGDEHHVAEAGLGVESEDHAARSHIGAHHLHHADRQRDLEMVEAVVDAIDDAAVGEQRGEAESAGLEQILRATDVQIALVLAGEAGGRQVLGRRRTAHGNSDIGAILGLKLAIGIDDGLAQGIGPGGAIDDVTRLFRPFGQGRDVGDVESVQQCVQSGPSICLGECVAIGGGGQGKSVGNKHARGAQLRI